MTRFACAAALLIAACAPTGSALRGPVDAEVARRLQLTDAPIDADVTDRIDARLASPLDRDAAVRIALAASPRLRASLAQVGVASSSLVLRLGALDIDAAVRFYGGAAEYEVSATQDVLGLITAARVRGGGHAELAAARAAATGMALRLVAHVEVAFHDLIAAQQDLELARVAFAAADAAALLRERMYDAGNTPALAQARDRDAREQARIDVARAEARIEVRREAVNARLGLSGARTKWTATGRLAELPAREPALATLEPTAVAASLDLAADRARIEAAANRAGVQRLQSWLPHLGVGISVEKPHGGPGEDDGLGVGPSLRLGLPLLDWNVAGRTRANAEVRVAEHALSATAIELRAAARAARVTAIAAYREARHIGDVLIPLRQQIVDETVKHYNAMDADPFQLVLARRQLADAGYLLVDATRRYWNAMAEVTALQRGVMLDDRVADIPALGGAGERPSGDEHPR